MGSVGGVDRPDRSVFLSMILNVMQVTALESEDEEGEEGEEGTAMGDRRSDECATCGRVFHNPQASSPVSIQCTASPFFDDHPKN